MVINIKNTEWCKYEEILPSTLKRSLTIKHDAYNIGQGLQSHLNVTWLEGLLRRVIHVHGRNLWKHDAFVKGRQVLISLSHRLLYCLPPNINKSY